MKPLLACSLLVLSLTSQENLDREAAPIRAETDAYLSVDRKYASGDTLGLWLRTTDGKTTKVWDGEPYDCRALPDKSVLIVERWEHRVLWLSPEGKVLFRKGGFARPTDIEMAVDGTILVVEHDAGCVTGIDPDSGDVVFRRTGFREPFDCAPLEDGGILVADSGNDRVVELDAEGKVRARITGLDHPNTCERLDDGSTLVTNWTYGEVVEFDPEGKLRWRVKTGGVVYRAVRQLDGSTLVCDGTGRKLMFYDPSGKLTRTESFSPGCVDYEPIFEE